MADTWRVLILIVAMGAGGALLYAAVAAIGVWTEHLRQGASGGGADGARLQDLEERVASVPALEARVLELEERLDFAERLLAKADEARLPAGREE